MPGRTSLFLCFLALLAALNAPVHAGPKREDEPNLVRISNRIFDLRMDATKLPRSPDFIPLTDIPWLRMLIDDDPFLGGIVFHIQQTRVPADLFWTFPGPGNLHRSRDGIPDRFVFDGYDTMASEPGGSGRSYMFVPNDPSEPYSIRCGTRTGDLEELNVCFLRVSYPPDNMIFLLARICFPEPLEDLSGSFPAMAKRMREIVYCLDVTEAERELALDATETRSFLAVVSGRESEPRLHRLPFAQHLAAMWQARKGMKRARISFEDSPRLRVAVIDPFHAFGLVGDDRLPGGRAMTPFLAAITTKRGRV
ncbi:MAG: hypothetical protein ACK4GW_14815 [Pseudorhodobacter sp.]